MNPPGLTGDQQDWSRKCGIRAFFDIVVEYDKKRDSWQFEGLGFEFRTYRTTNYIEPGISTWPDGFDPFAPDVQCVTDYLEADVRRAGDAPGAFVHLSIPLWSAEQISDDVFASKCLKELGRYWDLFGEWEDGA